MSYNSKPIDPWRVGMARQDWTGFQHPMTKKTIAKRFIGGEELIGSLLAISTIGKVTVYADSLPGAKCPECGTNMVVHGVTLASGDMAYWPHCIAHPTRKDHGYGKFSKHGNRSPNGRSPVRNGNEPEPEPSNEPEPTPEPEPEPIKAAVVHERFTDVLALYRAGVRAFLLEGPAGSGKTSIAYTLATHLGVECVTVSGSRETEKGELSKRTHPVTGKESLSPFLAALVRAGNVGVIDEVDGIPPDVLLGMNEPVANRQLSVNGERVHLHPDAVIIATANCTNGSSRVYTGRYPMDGATKSRLQPVFCDYSPAIERAVCTDDGIRSTVNEIRARVNNDPRLAKDWAAQVGTRLLIQAEITGKAFGLKGRAAVAKHIRLGAPEEVARQVLGE